MDFKVIKKALQMGKLGKAIRLGEETLGGEGTKIWCRRNKTQF